MTTNRLVYKASLLMGAVVSATALGSAQTQYAVSDAQLQNNIATALHADAKLKNTAILAGVSQGVVTLTGTVPTEEARAEAEQAAAGVSGVRSIQDNLDVTGGQAQAGTSGKPSPGTPQVSTTEAPPPPDEPENTQANNMPPPPPADSPQNRPENRPNQPYTPYPSGSQTAQGSGRAPYEQNYPAHNYPYDTQGSAEYGPRGNAHPPAPTLGVSPERQDASGPVTIPANTLLSIRTTDPLSTRNLRDGDFFQAAAAANVYSGDVLAIPRGAALTGQVIESKKAGALGGAPLLELRIFSIQLDSATIPLQTDVWSSQGRSKTGYTATNTVGGAAVGAIIGAIAGGGVGAGVGAIAGGTTGVLVSGATHGPQLDLPAEAVLQFRLAEPVTLQPVRYEEAVRLSASVPQGPVLQPRPEYVAAPYPYVVRPYPYVARPYGYPDYGGGYPYVYYRRYGQW